jgi:methyl-accepting chemotaxis protein
MVAAVGKHDWKTVNLLTTTSAVPRAKAVSEQLSMLEEVNGQKGAEYAKDIQATFEGARTATCLFVFFAIVVGALASYMITRQIVIPLAEVNEGMHTLQSACAMELGKGVAAMAEGDLTYAVRSGTQPLQVRSKDEVGRLSTSFNQLLKQIQDTIASYTACQDSLSGLVQRLRQASAQVFGASETLSATAQQVEASSEEIGSSMQQVASASTQAARGASEVARGSASQAQAIGVGSQGIQTLVGSINGVAGDTREVAKAAENAGEAAAEGTRAMDASMKGMKLIRDTVAHSAGVIDTLGKSSQKIGTIVQTINEIADQTNLLALNAAIEAARAGEAGRGFAVVADEVRKLAERSSGATKEIAALITEIQSHTEKAVKAMESGTKEVEGQTKVAESTSEVFEKIRSLVADVKDGVEGIRTATEQMAQASEGVSRSVSEVAAVVEQSSAAAEELSASSEEVSASVDTVAAAAQQQSAAAKELVASSDELQNLSRELTEAVSAFRIAGARADTGSYADQGLRRAA